MRSRSRQFVAGVRGFTLVELLIVITIIGILIGLLLPAVNAAREQGRNATCKNNLMQVGRATAQHVEAQGFFPTGGWGWYWDGDPDSGFGEGQPGGWVYNLLPYAEMNAVHDLGRYGTAAQKQQAVLQMVNTPWPILNCPTRRRAQLYPNNPNTATIAYNAGGVSKANYLVARTDYAVLVGSTAFDEYGAGPGSTSASDIAGYFGSRVLQFKGPGGNTISQSTNVAFNQCTGISFERSTIRDTDVRDGCSQTILAGEKYLGLNSYKTGNVGADNENMYVGMDNDIGRTTSAPPAQDRWGYDNTMIFGSAHANSCNFVMCDGSAFSVNYSVDPTTFLALGTRAGQDTVDMTKL